MWFCGKNEVSPYLQIGHILHMALLDKYEAIFGTSEAIKAYAVKDWAERLLEAGAQVSSVNPPGVWWGLRTSANENRAETAINAQPDAVLDLYEHLDDLTIANPAKGFGR